jgi:2'-5' RNA ligase
MGHRIFIAINLPEGVKKELGQAQRKFLELPARWTKKENLHITLVFLGNVSDQELPEICQIVREAAQRNKGFEIKLEKVSFGPLNKKPPRMVWAIGGKSKELGKLQRDLENSLLDSANKANQTEGKAFSPHITLARLKTWETRKLEPEEIPDVNENINLSFEVESIEIMESFLKKGGPEYIVLESCRLK